MVCFHAEQGAEKCLKAFLRARTGDVPRVHSLAKLIELCSKHDHSFLRLKNRALSLDRYYIPTRYPEASPGALPEGLLDHLDAQSALADMRKSANMSENSFANQCRDPFYELLSGEKTFSSIHCCPVKVRSGAIAGVPYF